MLRLCRFVCVLLALGMLAGAGQTTAQMLQAAPETGVLVRGAGVPTAFLPDSAPVDRSILLAKDFVVTSAADAGPGTLRQALLDALNGDRVTFDAAVFSPAHPATIGLATPLPQIIQGNLTIDASNAGVILNGAALSGADGLYITSNGNIIRGLQIIGFPEDGVEISGGAKHNIIGGDWTKGSAPRGEGNIITLNKSHGVYINGTGTMSNTVSGNLIGLDADGTRDLRVQAIAISPGFVSDRTLLIGTRFHGLWKTIDAGDNWFAVNAGLTISSALSLVVSPAFGADGTVFAGTANGGIFGSTDRGASWTQVDQGVLRGNVGALAISPDYARDRTVFAAAWEGVYASTDGGSTWEGRNGGMGRLNVNAIAVSPAYHSDRTVFIGTREKLALKSVDGGITWSPSNVGLDPQEVTALAFSPNYAVDHTLFAACAFKTWDESCGSLFRSTNGGASWIGVGGDPGWCTIERIVPSPNYATDGIVFVADQWSGVYRSQDRGEHWEHTLAGAGFDALVVSPGYVGDGTLLVGTEGEGIFRSWDGGGTWASVSTALTERGNYLDGVRVSDGAQGNTIGGDSRGQANVISNNGYQGIVLSGAMVNRNVVRGNLVGTDASGAAPLGNTGDGIQLESGAQNNLIGGSRAEHRNIVSANRWSDVDLMGEGTEGNVVSGNYIGTDVSGSFALGWTRVSGVRIWGLARANRVGGSTAGERNIISGIDATGVELGEPSDHNVIVGNYIGTNASGQIALGNGIGMTISHSEHNSIGSATAGAGNLISGNRSGGIQILSGGDYTTIIGNQIGTNADGSAFIPNAGRGILVSDAAHHNRIGGSGSGEGNVIGGNREGGVGVYSPGTNVTISRNSIYSNVGKGIALWDGGNRELPAPMITGIERATGTVTGTACPSCIVEVFSDDEDEGRRYEGSATANGAGNWTYRKGSALAGPRVTSTATDSEGNTSEFSTPADVPGPTPLPVEQCYGSVAGDAVYRVPAALFRGYTTASASASPLIEIPSPPAPQGWNQPGFAPDGSWLSASGVWWSAWSAPSWGPLLPDCSIIGLAEEGGRPEGIPGITHLIRTTFVVQPPQDGMRISRATLAMWSDNKSAWWWQGERIATGREGYGGLVEIFPGRMSAQGGTYVLAVQNSNDFMNAHGNPQGTAYRLCVTWRPGSDWTPGAYLPLICRNTR